MIGKIVISSNSYGCARYCLDRDEARILCSDGLDIDLELMTRLNEAVNAERNALSGIHNMSSSDIAIQAAILMSTIILNLVVNDGKRLDDDFIRRRNINVCKDLNRAYGLHWSRWKDNSDIEKSSVRKRPDMNSTTLSSPLYMEVPDGEISRRSCLAGMSPVSW